MIVILILIISLGLFPAYTLEITENGNRIFSTQIKSGDRFSLSYIHSIQLSPVTENFEIDQDHHIILTDMTFSDHGAGLPYNAFCGVFSTQNGKFRISNMNMPFSEINLRVGREYDNVFIMGNRTVNLSEKFGDALILIRIGKHSFLRII